MTKRYKPKGLAVPPNPPLLPEDIFDPMLTPEEAEAEFDVATPEPMSDEEVADMTESILWRIHNHEQLSHIRAIVEET